MSLRGDWESEVRRRFDGRPSLSDIELASMFNPSLDPLELASLRELLQLEFSLDLGVLRPDDPLELLTEHPNSRGNPIRWLVYESSSRDATNEVDEQLTIRLKRLGFDQPTFRVKTIGDLL